MTSLSRQEAEFTARVSADATHEMRNILAIVKESAGLIGDILMACDDGAPVDRAKVTRTLQRIDAQVGRGVELMTHLSRFAHSLERRRQAIDPGLEVEQAVFLGQRSARRRRIDLRAAPPTCGTPFTGDPFRVQMAISTAVEWWLPRIPEGASVLLKADTVHGRPAVELSGQACDEAPLPLLDTDTRDWWVLMALLDGLGAAAEIAEGGRGFRVLVSEEV